MTTATEPRTRFDKTPPLRYRLLKGKHVQDVKQEDGTFKEVQFRPGAEFECDSPVVFADRDKFELIDVRNSPLPEVIVKDETERLDNETPEQHKQRMKKAIERLQAAVADTNGLSHAEGTTATATGTVTSYNADNLSKLNAAELKAICSTLGLDVGKHNGDKGKLIQAILSK